MTSIRNVTETIVEWKQSGWDEIVGKIDKFRELSGVENLVFGDAESFDCAESYLNLLKDSATLMIENLPITELKVVAEDARWNYEFSINNTVESIVLDVDCPEWLNEGFIKSFNEILKKHGSKIFGRFVHPTGIDRQDQCFHLCFITDETYSVLKKSKPRYA